LKFAKFSIIWVSNLNLLQKASIKLALKNGYLKVSTLRWKLNKKSYLSLFTYPRPLKEKRNKKEDRKNKKIKLLILKLIMSHLSI